MTCENCECKTPLEQENARLQAAVGALSERLDKVEAELAWTSRQIIKFREKLPWRTDPPRYPYEGPR